MSEGGGRPDLDDLIEKFEEEVRKRPTPDELAAAERAQLSGEAIPAAPAAEPGAAIEPEAPEPAGAAAEPVLLPSDIEGWWNAGERLQLQLPGGVRREIFARAVGQGPWLTMIHGFPTSSWDWAPMLPALAADHRVLVFDLLGFGESDKPTGHDWSSFEQADILEALWKHLDTGDTRVVAHDVGLTVALELLARQREGTLPVRLVDVTLLNGGVYAGFHRPRPIQGWLQRPVVGPLIARMLSEARFGTALSEVFGPTHQPGREALHQHWLSVARRDGSRNYHRLIRYIAERRAHAARWENALEKTSVPIRFVWGMADPVSGLPMVEVIRQRRPGADIVELADVGHYPQLEDPTSVVEAILRAGHGRSYGSGQA